ncbi:hypothetical protein [Variovorax sp. HJSM1_2]|uniref:hypothetical protein n=1 Tax=Variovorax sp. HJSM1_2 TaxID=3366263 RepID=UPI003BDF538D
MGMALFSHSVAMTGWASALHGLKDWLAAGKSQAQRHTLATAASYRELQAPTRSACSTPNRVARPAAGIQPFAHAPARATPRAAARPLRVVRVIDTASAAASAGRMVISGRMADVCAELDRLAATEANTGPTLAQ